LFGYYTTGNYSVSQFFFFVSDLLLLACHEGYPGYHVTNLLFEDRLSRKRRWVEFIVIPLYSPLLLIMEGVANYALELAFPVDERIAFSHDCLYPLAGLDPALAKSAVPIFEATEALSDFGVSVASPEAARRHLDGHLGRSEMIAWLTTHTLYPPEMAESTAQFVGKFRSYMICYSLGQDLVKRRIEERAGADREKRWREFERLQSPPRPPSDLL